MFQKILVAIDGSEMGEKALDVALAIAKEEQVELSLLHVGKEVVVSPYMVGEMAYISKHYDIDFNEAMRKEAEELLNKAKAKAEAQGVAATPVYLKGDAARQIVDYADKNKYQLIVIGSRGLSGFKEMMLGSVSHKVSQLATCPVLIVK
ncbi:universal stress protein [Aneurinibacillus thermoaerophilus]|uniref:Nucleotide-binding universal stress protein, UspA family n=1 Tax=Aneurinibacillus thermoaerophilus TaxID=143495 RepID=A0A1G7ZN83_ANETH|nr:universal stress protein [Aneurinibacillus thermoaerophilus]MED0757263.1 universal stress protein [Aneurinibacillus thermoaerophilus]MED0762073.1 universal stress protein [Aneurinibacillus thermoaerophilus]SDH10027.1 Nucleotide-binding universal stress protein, UspA family [Aneurinibacillus thermoaerophilus]